MCDCDSEISHVTMRCGCGVSTRSQRGLRTPSFSILPIAVEHKFGEILFDFQYGCEYDSKRSIWARYTWESLRGLLFQVPSYQRYYSWNNEQLRDLWTDLQTLPVDKDHYFGTVILQETPESDNREPQRVMAEEQRKHLIIDGQ
jgi:hypothetical protein